MLNWIRLSRRLQGVQRIYFELVISKLETRFNVKSQWIRNRTNEYATLLQHVRLRGSACQEDAHSLTLSNRSESRDSHRSHGQRQPSQHNISHAQRWLEAVPKPPPPVLQYNRRPSVEAAPYPAPPVLMRFWSPVSPLSG